MSNALTEKDIRHIEDILKRKRDEIIDIRGRLDSSWEKLRDREVEFEENAAKEKISSDLERLEFQQEQELNAIDDALRRIEAGNYGRCRSCGRPISFGRLEALPWTLYCTSCASKRQKKETEAPEEEILQNAAAPPPDFEGMSDEELQTAVYEELKNDGRIEMDELDVSVTNGIVHFEGILPSEDSHQVLLEIVQDVMGFQEIDDHLDIDRQAWEKNDRGEPPGVRKTEEDKILESDSEEEDAYESLKSGKPLIPPDKLVPEKE
ncbi:MAG: TraR/DksA C4-type zinc finger protein [Syntrophales bacterium]|jgi:DnaK suppressor protein|nr:TraR/DksA C4-type zinc finger protein [Syntrophales bacterium]